VKFSNNLTETTKEKRIRMTIALNLTSRRRSVVPLGFGSSTPRTNVSQFKNIGITKPVSPKFSTTERLQKRRSFSRMEPSKTDLQKETDIITKWFMEVFERKMKSDPYMISQYDRNLPQMSMIEFKEEVLQRNLRLCLSSLKEGILDENLQLGKHTVRHVLKMHKAMFDVKNKDTVILKKTPGASVVNLNIKNEPVLFKEI
jgi:hypothetical protein